MPALRLAELMLQCEQATLSPSAFDDQRVDAFGAQVHATLEQPKDTAEAVIAATRGFISRQRGGAARMKQFDDLVADMAARTQLRDAKNTKAQLFAIPAVLGGLESTQALDSETCAEHSQRIAQQLAARSPLGVAAFPLALSAAQWRAGGPAARFKLLKRFAHATATDSPLAAASQLLEACEFTPATRPVQCWRPVCVWLKAEQPLLRDLAGSELRTVASALAA